MKKKTAYAVFTTTHSGLDYMVQSNFGEDEEAANQWRRNHLNDLTPEWNPITSKTVNVYKYPNGLFVKEVKY